MRLTSILLTFVGCAWLTGCQTVTNKNASASPGGTCAVLVETCAAPSSELLLLDSLLAPERWVTAECTVSSDLDDVNNQPLLHLQIPVDHQAGEIKYPIGWPRITLKTRVDESQWFNYDSLSFAIYTQVSRPEMSKIPISLAIYCASQSYLENISAKHGEWLEITIPLDKLPAPGIVTGLRFSISESNYQHLDVLDFKIGKFRLLRNANCEVSELSLGSPQGNNGLYLPVTLKVTDVSSDTPRGVPMQISQNALILRRETLPVKRGDFSFLMDLSELQLAPGKYTLTIFPGQDSKSLTRDFELK